MRKLIALALAAATLTMGVPATVMAQTASQYSVVSGEAVDAGGRALPGQRVELVQSSQVVQTTTTDMRGTFTFASVPAGEYIVRLMINGQPAGVRVSVAPGATVANTVIVAPSAVAPSGAFIAALGLLWGTVAVAAVAAAIITTAVVVTGS